MRQTLFPFLLILSLVVTAIEIEISVPSFLEMTQYFAASQSDIEFTLSFNLLGFCLGALCYGPLSDSLGRRKVMLGGNALLLIGAIGCAFACNLVELYTARVIQGLGAATSAVVVFAMVSDSYSEKESVKILGIFNAIFASLIAISPIVGGILQQHFGWRGNYGFLAFLSLISFVLLSFFLPETQKEKSAFYLKTVLYQYKVLFSDPLFLVAALVPSLLYATYCAFVAFAPFLYLETFHLSLSHYTLHQSVIIAVFSLTSFFAPKGVDYFGSKKTIMLGIFFCLASSFAFLGVSHFKRDNPFLISTLMGLFCVGFALIYPIIFAKSLEIYKEIKGIASSAIMSLRTLLMALIITSTGMVYNETAISLASGMSFITVIIFVMTIFLLSRNIFND